VPVSNVECILCAGREREREGSGQIEINLLLFPSNRLTSEIVLVDLSKTWKGREREWRTEKTPM
jgi:hypothetical protein